MFEAPELARMAEAVPLRRRARPRRRSIQESPPYFHDGRYLTLEDTVELFNLILGLRLSAGETAFMRQL